MTKKWNGLPPDPEQSERFWLQRAKSQETAVFTWIPDLWFNPWNDAAYSQDEAADLFTYLGPATPPTEPAQLLPGQILE